jgi:large subunit ribosomal protein L23
VNDPHQIVKRPVITEMATRLMDKENKYVFRVAPAANKREIRHAIETLFSVEVERVTTMNVRGKTKMYRSGQPGRAANWKKAIVKLKKGYSIDLL